MKKRKTIKEFLEKVTNENFIQVHKSFIVNKEYIVTIEFTKISMTNGIIVPFSRTFKARFSKENVKKYSFMGIYFVIC